MARQLEADIIIKGAGPVGLSMANLLGVYDNRTLVLKQNATTVEEPRAIALVLRTAAHCNPWDSKKITSAEMIQGFELDYLNTKGRTIMDVEVGESPYGRVESEVCFHYTKERAIRHNSERPDRRADRVVGNLPTIRPAVPRQVHSRHVQYRRRRRVTQELYGALQILKVRGMGWA